MNDAGHPIVIQRVAGNSCASAWIRPAALVEVALVRIDESRLAGCDSCLLGMDDMRPWREALKDYMVVKGHTRSGPGLSPKVIAGDPREVGCVCLALCRSDSKAPLNVSGRRLSNLDRFKNYCVWA